MRTWNHHHYHHHALIQPPLPVRGKMASAINSHTASPLSFSPVRIAEKVRLQPPLSRRGTGPGLLLLIPASYHGRGGAAATAKTKTTLDPEPLQKWAEESFAVVEVGVSDANVAKEACLAGIKALKELPECISTDKIGVIAYELDLDIHRPESVSLWSCLRHIPEIAATVLYTDKTSLAGGEELSFSPGLTHTTRKAISTTTAHVLHSYDAVASPHFVLPGHEDYKAGPAGVSHTRSLEFLRTHLGGPHFDLESIWEEHCLFEFGERNVEKTMSTMVEEPYVNHVPTMTGGVGRTALTAFYRDHFIFANPEDTALELISRTVGVDRVIDEFIFCFTHTRVIDWLVPGIPPTGKHVRIPFTSVVNIRGDRLYHEHIAWDQASVLRQLGLLPEYLPFPYPLPDGRVPAKGKRFEYRVPASGVDTARKMEDENSAVSNEMLGFDIREVDDV